MTSLSGCSLNLIMYTRAGALLGCILYNRSYCTQNNYGQQAGQYHQSART
jgi:hypothetical protein